MLRTVQDTPAHTHMLIGSALGIVKAGQQALPLLHEMNYNTVQGTLTTLSGCLCAHNIPSEALQAVRIRTLAA